MWYSWLFAYTSFSILINFCHASALPYQGNATVLDKTVTTGPHLAVLGDSWGSGVAYSITNAYDNNKDYCLRWKEAYGAQLEKDISITPHVEGNMQFVACSGSRLVNIVQEQSSQMNRLSGPLDAIIMTIGGNNARFFDVVNSCIYHWPINAEYGPKYPDPKGKCAIAIADARGYIKRTGPESFKFDLYATYKDMLGTEMMKTNKNLKVYQTGYARFFSTDGSGKADWCEATQASFIVSFGPFKGQASPLTKELRTDINALVSEANDVIKAMLAEKDLNGRFRFIDIDPAFEKRRFCEVGSDLNKQYFDSNIWIWNLVAPGYGASNPAVGAIPPNLENDPGFAFDQPAIDPSIFLSNPPTIASGGNSIAWGWSLRPFHPKGPAYTAIKNIIEQRLRADKIPGA